MTALPLSILLVAGLLSPANAAASADSACDIGHVTGSRELHDLLSRRAVEVVNRAASASWQTDARLAQLVAPDAAFNLGTGDVGRPLGQGVPGARALVGTMMADTFRFPNWNWMDVRADPCAERKLDIEFIDSGSKHIARVEFTFGNGRVMSAKGWVQSFETGPITKVTKRP